MKHIKTLEVPATTREIVEFVSCDLCNAKIERTGYNVDNVEIRRKTGVNYPEGGSGKETVVDMCGKCFNEKLVPWLCSQGAEPRDEDWEW